MRLLHFFIILSLSITTCSYAKKGKLKNKDGEKTLSVVEVEKVVRSDIIQTAKLIGTIKAKHSTTLVAKTTGMLDYVVQSGQRVRKGVVIAKLENADIKKSVDLAEDAASIAKDIYSKTSSLEKENIVSKSDLAQQKHKWISAQRDLASAKVELDKTRFIAPFDGIVGIYKIREGSQVQQGDQIVTFYDPSRIVVEFDIPAQFIREIKDGQPVKIGDKTLHLHFIQKMVDPDTYMAPAYVDYPTTDRFVGENVDVDLLVTERKNTIVIPSDALFLKDGKESVYIIKDSKCILKQVKIGIKEKEHIEIREGIEEGDQVVKIGPDRLHPDEQVKVAQ